MKGFNTVVPEGSEAIVSLGGSRPWFPGRYKSIISWESEIHVT